MEDIERILQEAEKESLKSSQALLRLVLDMWKNARSELRQSTESAKKLKIVSIIASVIAAFCLVGCIYLGTVVHRQQGEIDAIWDIFEQGVVIEETTTEETITTETVTQNTGEGNGNNIYQAGDYSTYTQEVAGE